MKTKEELKKEHKSEIEKSLKNQIELYKEKVYLLEYIYKIIKDSKLTFGREFSRITKRETELLFAKARTLDTRYIEAFIWIRKKDYFDGQFELLIGNKGWDYANSFVIRMNGRDDIEGLKEGLLKLIENLEHSLFEYESELFNIDVVMEEYDIYLERVEKNNKFSNSLTYISKDILNVRTVY
jgi:hypothetical protein